MSAFTETVEAKLAGRTVYVALLAHFDFSEGVIRLANTNTKVVAGGEEWLGAGILGSVEGLERAVGTQAAKITCKLSGVDSTVMASANSVGIVGRECTIYVQVFDENRQPLDDMVAIAFGEAEEVVFESSGPSQRAVSVTFENFFSTRNRPPYSYYTDRDQNDRFSGDRGLEFIASMVNKKVTFPDATD